MLTNQVVSNFAGSIYGHTDYTVCCCSGIDLGDSAARVLKKPDLATCDGLEELAKEAGIHSFSKSVKEETSYHRTGKLWFDRHYVLIKYNSYFIMVIWIMVI
ncbi:hypothetical protein WN944_007705 [Citrus x changshan-huyou]|uniref:Uncharacterized protein n=1 Tax=Citrus x changshan-huyou TaxID=2935761 RepID=A0AAP0QV65_9ROSI